MASTDQQHTDTAVDDDTWMIEVDGQLVPDYDRTLTNFSEGDVVSGTVVRVDKDEILVDIGYKSEGVIPISSCRSAGRSTRTKRSRSVTRSMP